MSGLPLAPADSYNASVYSTITLWQPPFWWGGSGYIYEENLVVGHGYWMEDSVGVTANSQGLSAAIPLESAASRTVHPGGVPDEQVGTE